MKLCSRVLAASFCFLSASAPLLAQESAGDSSGKSEYNDTMKELLFPGRKLVIESGDYHLEVAFFRDGTYRASNGSYGTWTMMGERLCTVTKDDVHSCGRIPSKKRINDRWSTEDHEKRAVTVTIQ